MKATSNVYLLGFMFTLCIVIIDSSCSSNYPNRQRSTRGFKNAALSTARGFGKRDGVLRGSGATMDFLDRDNVEGFRKIPFDSERYSLSWLIDELSKNPRFVGLVNRRTLNQEVVPNDSSSEEFSHNREY